MLTERVRDSSQTAGAVPSSRKEWAPGLFLVSEPPLAAFESAEIAVIANVRDEAWRLPFWLAYHRWLGVRHFGVVSNRSTDATLEFLARQPDVTLLDAPGPFEDSRWKLELLKRAPPGRWNLILDADELFISLPWAEGGLRRFTRRLDEEGAEAAMTVMVDCYPESLPVDPAAASPVPWRRAPYFDPGPYFSWEAAKRRLRHRSGGVRERLFYPNWKYLRTLRRFLPKRLGRRLIGEGPPFLRKMPLLKNVPGLVYKVIHTSRGVSVSGELTALLHYKLDVDFDAKVAGALAERQYPAHGEYEAYGQYTGGRALRLKTKASVTFDRAEDLERNQMLAISSAYESELRSEGLGSVSKDEAERQVLAQTDLDALARLWAARWGSAPARES